MGKRVANRIFGINAPAPRPTGRALALLALYGALPLITALILFDVVVWWIADSVWGVCIGLWCLL